MRIIVISDTHIPDRYPQLPARVENDMKNADLIVHAGDFTSLEFYEWLGSFGKKIKAVSGNMDNRDLASRLDEKLIFHAGKFKIGLMHGFGKPDVLLANVKRSFDSSLDLVIFGHSHNAFNEKIGKTIFFNPGSPTDKIFSSCNSYGKIDINDTVKAEIMRI